jgi:chemotaxis protein MotA
MDSATLIGLTVAFGCCVVSLFMEGGSLGAFFHPAPMILVFGGTIGATMIGFSMKNVTGLPRIVKNAFLGKPIDRIAALKTLVDLASKARKEGILALEAESKNVENPFLRGALQLVVDGEQLEVVRSVLETEVAAMRERHKVGEEFFGAAGAFAPTLGIIGTVMGLVNMLESLDDPGSMGPAIAAAFIATLWGVISANLMFLPISAKLKSRSLQEAASYELITEGVIGIAGGENPRAVEMRLKSFLAPSERLLLGADDGVGQAART